MLLRRRGYRGWRGQRPTPTPLQQTNSTQALVSGRRRIILIRQWQKVGGLPSWLTIAPELMDGTPTAGADNAAEDAEDGAGAEADGRGGKKKRVAETDEALEGLPAPTQPDAGDQHTVMHGLAELQRAAAADGATASGAAGSSAAGPSAVAGPPLPPSAFTFDAAYGFAPVGGPSGRRGRAARKARAKTAR